jgi:hypothetical protein
MMEGGLIPPETTGINQRATQLPLPGPLSWYRFCSRAPDGSSIMAGIRDSLLDLWTA